MYQLLIEQRNYSHLPTYVFKAEAALDAAATASASKEANDNGTTPATSTTKKVSAEREKVQSKLDFATALSHLGQGNYEKAAYHFTRLGAVKDLGDWIGKVYTLGAIIMLHS